MPLTAAYAPPYAAHTARRSHGASSDGLHVAIRLSVSDISPDADVLALALHIADACAQLPPAVAAARPGNGRSYVSHTVPPIRDLNMRKCAAAYARRVAHLSATPSGAAGTVRPMTFGARRSALVSQAIRAAGLSHRAASSSASLGEYVGGAFVSGRHARVGLLSVVGGGSLPSILVNIPRRGPHAPPALYAAIWGGVGGSARASAPNMNTPLTVFRVSCTVALADAIDPPPAASPAPRGGTKTPAARAYTVSAYDVELDEGDDDDDDDADDVDDDRVVAVVPPKGAPAHATADKPRRAAPSRRRQRASDSDAGSSSASKRTRTEDAAESTGSATTSA